LDLSERLKIGGIKMSHICICGKVLDGEETCCSPRCEYIVEHMGLLLDRQAAELVKAKKYFGEEWDKENP
jgi:hypothetical protein